MIPLWAKGRDGKYHRFPYEDLQILPNGKLGLQSPIDPDYHWALNKFLQLCEDTGWDINHFFDYNINMDAYVLKEKP